MKQHIPALFLLFFAAALHAAPSQCLASMDETPAGVSSSDWQSIRAAYEAGRHAFHPVEGRDGVWRAGNPGQQWATAFDGRGFVVRPQSGGWTWGLDLKSYGFGENQREVGGTPEVKADGQRLSYQWDSNVQEWYINDQRGLEHGFIISGRPGGASAEELSFTIGIRGGLTPSVSDGSVSFQDASGNTVLNYSGLKVWDADGKILPSRFEPAELSGFRLLVDETAARYPITVDPIAQQAYLKASNTGSGDLFGYSVAVSGDTVVVGAYLEDGSGTGVDPAEDDAVEAAGAAYVFTRTGTAWTQQAYLKASNTGDSDLFGWSVAVSGDTVVVGAYAEDGSGMGVDPADDNGAATSGAAYVFTRTGTAWTQQAYLKASNTGAGDHFGWSVAVSVDTVVVGALGEDNGASDAGAAYVFTRTGSAWTQQAYLKASNTGTSDQFGWSVAVSGDTVVVGARFEDGSGTGVDPADDDAASNAGAAYVFTRTGTAWTQQARLKASNTGTSDQFGYSVAVSGDTVVVGAYLEDGSGTGVDPAEDNGASSAGAAYVFTRTGTAWTQQAYLKASNTGDSDEFGFTVAVSGDTVVVGAYAEDGSGTGVDPADDNGAATSGAVYVYTRTGTAWTQHAYLKASNTGAGDQFGRSVAVSGDTVVVGAYAEDGSGTGVDPADDNGASSAGAAYTFRLPSCLNLENTVALPAQFSNPRSNFNPQGIGYDPFADELLFIQQSSFKILRTDRGGNYLGEKSISSYNYTTDVAADETRYFFSDYTSNTSGLDIYQVNKSTGTPTAFSSEIAAYGGTPIDVRNGKLYRTAPSNSYSYSNLNTIRVSDLGAPDTILQTITLQGASPIADFGIDTDSGSIWVLEYATPAAIRRYDLSNGNLLDTCSLGLNGLTGSITYAEGKIYYYDWQSGSGSTLTSYEIEGYVATPCTITNDGYPAKGGVTFAGSGNAARAGGSTWNFSNFDFSQFDALYYGFNTAFLPKVSMNNGPGFTAGENLAFDAGASNLAGGVAVWSGNSNFTYGTPTPSTNNHKLRYTLTISGAGAAGGFIPSSNLLAIDPTFDTSQEVVAQITGNFTLHRLIEAEFPANSGTWVPINDLFDSQSTVNGDGTRQDAGFAFYSKYCAGVVLAAVDDDYTTSNPITEDQTLSIPAAGVLANDSGASLVITTSDATSVNGAAVTVNPDGSFSYDPTGSAAHQALDVGATLIDTFTYTIAEDGTTTPTSTATVSIQVTGINDAPVANNDANSVTESADAILNPTASGNVLSNDTDVDDPVSSFTVTNAGTIAGAYGSFALNANGSYTYTLDDANPAVQALHAGTSLLDTITYQMSDNHSGGNVKSDSADLEITINGVNDAPVVSLPIADVTVYTSSPSLNIPLFPHFEDVDADDDDTTLVYTVETNTNTGLVMTAVVDSADGILSITTPCSLSGTAQLTVRATDSHATFAQDTFTVTVVDDILPVIICAKDIVVSVPVGSTAAGLVSYETTASDACEGALPVSFSISSSFAFPIGVTQVTATATDSGGNTVMATFNVVVLAIAETPGTRFVDVVSVSGDEATGVDVPAGATIRNINRAFLNNFGNVLFSANLDGGTSGVFSGASATGPFTAIAVEGAASGAGPYGGFSDLTLNDAGDTGFASRLGGGPAHFANASASAVQGGIATATGGGEIYRSLQKPALASGGVLLTRANLVIGSGAGVTSGDDTVITGSDGSLIAREGDVAPGTGGDLYSGLHSRVVASEDNNHYAFTAFLKPTSLSLNTALFTGTAGGGAPAIAVQEGDAAPGTGGGVIDLFQAEVVNGAGEIALRGTARGAGITSANSEAIWTNSGGSLELVAREGAAVPCMPPPFQGLVAFDRFTTLAIADDGSVHFFAYLRNATPSAVVNSGNDGSIWRWEDGELYLIAREGDAANNTDGGEIGRIDTFACSGAGGVVYRVGYVMGQGDATSVNRDGIYLDRGAGDAAPELVLRRGDSFDFRGESRTVTRLDVSTEENPGGGTGGYGRAINDAGDILLDLSLSGNFTGIFVLSP